MRFYVTPAASCKLQAASCKLQAASCKLQANQCGGWGGIEVKGFVLEAGSWKLEAGSWKLEAGSWKLEEDWVGAGWGQALCGVNAPLAESARSGFHFQHQASSFKLQASSFKLQASSFQRVCPDNCAQRKAPHCFQAGRFSISA